MEARFPKIDQFQRAKVTFRREKVSKRFEKWKSALGIKRRPEKWHNAWNVLCGEQHKPRFHFNSCILNLNLFGLVVASSYVFWSENSISTHKFSVSVSKMCHLQESTHCTNLSVSFIILDIFSKFFRENKRKEYEKWTFVAAGKKQKNEGKMGKTKKRNPHNYSQKYERMWVENGGKLRVFCDFSARNSNFY